MLGILGVVNEEFFAGGQFLHVGGGGGSIFWSKLFFLLFDDLNKSEGFFGFQPFLEGETIFAWGGV